MMKTLVRRWLYAGGLTLVFAAGARAQEIAPAEIPDSRVSPVLKPTPEDPILSWHVGYSGLSNSTVENGEVANTIDAGASRQWSWHRGGFNVGGAASQYFYANAADLSRFTFDVAASGFYQISRRAQFTIADRVSSGYARQASSVTEAQLAFPNAIVTSNGFMAGYGYDISRRTRFQVSTQYDNLIFNDTQPAIPPPNVVDQALLTGGGTFSFQTSLSRLLSHADSLGIAQGYSRQVNGAEQSQTISLHGTWQRPLSPTYSMSAEGGIDMFVTERLTGINIAPTGSASIQRKVKRNGNLAVRVTRSIEVMGATHISTSLNLEGGLKIRKRLTLGGTLSAVHNDFPADPAFNYNPLIVGGSVAYNLPGNLVVAGSYSYWRRYSNSLPTQTTVTNQVSVSYARTWR
ncbi:MAG TPA: hypothetical protein VFI56_15345 [Vicinamibacterales bacterium]|jgi:hypothetical protein|nr:hypothetical protein [Vicinamibacterales bacterium]